MKRPLKRLWALTLVVVAIATIAGSAAHAATVTVCPVGCDHTTIQAAVDAASNGDIITVAAGTYTENLTLSKSVSLLGPNANVDPNTGSRGAEAIIDGGSGFTIKPQAAGVTINGFTILADPTGQAIYNVGAEAADVNDLTIVYNIVTGGIRALTLESDGDDISILHNKLAGFSRDIQAGDGTWNDLHINDNHLLAPVNPGYAVQGGPSGTGPVNGFEFSRNSVYSPVNIGSNITDGEVNDNLFEVPSGSGLNMQIVLHDSVVLRNTFEGGGDNACLQLFGSQFDLVPSANVLVTGNTFNDCNPYGVQFSPDNQGINITGNTFNGSYDGVNTRTATAWDVTGLDLHVNNNSILGSTHAGVYNGNAGTLDGTNNWFGTAAGPGALTGVNATPWCTDAACSTLSNNANLASLSLSSGTLSPVFSSSTTAYTANVGNDVTAVTVSQTAVAGANAVVSGGSNLAVGNNTVTVTVTSADSSATKTYTVTVTRAAAATPSPSPTPAPAPPADVCPNLGGVQTEVPDGRELVGGQCVLKPNAPQSVPASPDQSGTVSVVVAPTAPAGETPPEPVTVNVEWDPGTFATPVTVLVTPQVEAPVPVGTTPPSPTPVAGGFTVGTTTVQLTVTDSSGTVIHQFSKPLVIHVSASEAGDVPAYSQDGITWTTIPQLSSPSLPDGQPDGYFRNTDGSIDIYTRHATFFGLLKDVQAPSTPKNLKVRVEKTGLRLSWSGARDNVKVAGYVVSRNGHGYKATKQPHDVVLPLKAGIYVVRARDAVGNVSNPSAAITVVRTGNKKQPFAVAKS